MAISSINFAKSSGGSFAHNDRTISPDYLIDDSKLNEVSCSADQAQAKLQELYAEAKENYQATYGQKFQTKFENTHWEAVVNLNANHTLKDLEELSRAIEKETGFTTLQISIHRDEGKITEDGRKEKNYHAHINFFTCDRETGRQLYRRTISNSERERIRKETGLAKDEPIPKHLSAVMDKEKLSKLQDITALTLKMERGKKGSTAVRLDHRQYKIAAKEKEQHKEQIVNLTADNEQLRYNFREAQKRITALEGIDAEHKKELHRLNTEINKMKIEGATKDLKISELEAKIKEGQSLSDKYASLPIRERLEMRAEMREVLGENTELKSAKEEIKALKEAKAEPQHEPINASAIVKLQDEVKLLQLTNKALETELKETKSATVPKGENEASRQIEKYLEAIPKSVQIHSEIADLDVVRFETRAEAKEKNYQHGEKYAKHILDKHTGLMGKVDKEALIAELGKEFKETAVILSKGQEIVKDFKSVIDRTKSGFSNTLKTAEKAFKDVFSKITGKSTEQIQEQRREAERAIQQEKIKQAEAQKAKEPEQVKAPSRGLSLGR